MKKTTIFFQFFSFFLIFFNLLSAQDTPPKEELINGYKASEFYYKNITIPQEIATSTQPEDRINVIIHNKIIAFEMEKKRPLKSLPKLEMEALLKGFYSDGYREVYPQEEKVVSQPVAPKPKANTEE